MEIVMEVEAEDMESDEGRYLITADYTKFIDLKNALEGAGVEIEVGEIQKIADTTIPVSDEDQATKINRLVEALEDNEDVQAVYTNMELDDALADKLAEG